MDILNRTNLINHEAVAFIVCIRCYKVDMRNRQQVLRMLHRDFVQFVKPQVYIIHIVTEQPVHK